MTRAMAAGVTDRLWSVEESVAQQIKRGEAKNMDGEDKIIAELQRIGEELAKLRDLIEKQIARAPLPTRGQVIGMIVNAVLAGLLLWTFTHHRFPN